jgi:hypothetical protein
MHVGKGHKDNEVHHELDCSRNILLEKSASTPLNWQSMAAVPVALWADHPIALWFKPHNALMLLDSEVESRCLARAIRDDSSIQVSIFALEVSCLKTSECHANLRLLAPLTFLGTLCAKKACASIHVLVSHAGHAHMLDLQNVPFQ